MEVRQVSGNNRVAPWPFPAGTRGNDAMFRTCIQAVLALKEFSRSHFPRLGPGCATAYPRKSDCPREHPPRTDTRNSTPRPAAKSKPARGKDCTKLSSTKYGVVYLIDTSNQKVGLTCQLPRPIHLAPRSEQEGTFTYPAPSTTSQSGAIGRPLMHPRNGCSNVWPASMKGSRKP